MDDFEVVQKTKKTKPVEHLVLDTGAIIANVNLHNIAEHFYAPPEVLVELRSKKALTAYEQLPFEVVIREPSTDACKAVTEASKKTGDFQSLSITDLKVIALTYDLKQQLCGEPSVSTEEKADANIEEKPESVAVGEKCKMEESENTEGKSSVEEQASPITASKAQNLPEGFCEDVESDDDEGWITENNIVNALKKMGAIEVEEGSTVGCLTTDFALQNVLLAMNLSLVSVTGYRIKKIKSYVLRCRGCYSTTSNMEKVFCPSCGNKMLHKCAVSVDELGNQVLHINWNRLGNKRGLQHSLAGPKGGKHAMNEVLFEDQRVPQNRMAKLRLDPLADGPFEMHDTTSRSAMLGLRNFSKGGRKNPNEARGNRRKH